VYASVGYLFSAQVYGVVEQIAGFASIAVAVAVLLVLSATGWRVVRARIHADLHAKAAAVASIADTIETLHDAAGPGHDPEATVHPRTA